MPRTVQPQQGFAVATAIFLLVILALLGAFIANINSVQTTTLGQDIQGQRVFQSAQGGLEWGLYQVLDPLGTTVVAPGSPTWPNMPNCPAGGACNWCLPNCGAAATCTTLNFPPGAATPDFVVEVACERFPAGAVGAAGPPVYTESGDVRSSIVYRLTATARANGAVVGQPGFVERQLEATVTNCRDSSAVVAPYACP